MMEHLNFCRNLLLSEVLSDTEDAANVTRSRIASSVKFILPDGGVLIDDDELRALDAAELRLPFQTVALEYQTDAGTRCIALAWESDDGVVMQGLTAIDFPGRDRKWVVAGHEILSAIDNQPGKRALLRFDGNDDSEEHYGQAWVLVSFLNALACSNVRIQTSGQKKSGKKIKAALPFDTYHILTIDVPGKAGDGFSTGGHRSPREHLRRGHIRRLADSRRIWVNATVVAAGRGAGVVTKDYALRCAA
jgi:hypothetical protein